MNEFYDHRFITVFITNILNILMFDIFYLRYFFCVYVRTMILVTSLRNGTISYE